MAISRSSTSTAIILGNLEELDMLQKEDGKHSTEYQQKLKTVDSQYQERYGYSFSSMNEQEKNQAVGVAKHHQPVEDAIWDHENMLRPHRV